MMDCLHDTAPTDEELIALALDGEALSPEAQSHLDQCATCQQRLARYQQTTASLVRRLYRSQCPSGMELSLYSGDMLSPQDRQRVAAHLLDCPLCMAEVEESRRFLQAQPIDFSAPSFSPRALVRRIFASLVKRLQPQFVVRGEAQETAWPRHYKAEAVDLSLHLSRTGSGEPVLLGILTSTDPAEDVESLQGMLAELYTAPLPVESNGTLPKALPLLQTRIDDMGNIVFKPVPAGSYVMVIALPDREMIIEGLTIE